MKSAAKPSVETQQAMKRARRLLREQLADGPKPGAQIEAAAQAADIPKCWLIAAASALGVRTQRGQWWCRAEALEPHALGVAVRQDAKAVAFLLLPYASRTFGLGSG